MPLQKSSNFSQSIHVVSNKALIIAMVWFVCKGMFDVAVNSNMRFLNHAYGYHPFQLVFFYSSFSALVFAPAIFYHRKHYRISSPRLYALRGVLEIGGFSLLFFAVTMMPFATFTTLTFITPIIASLVAMYFLGEHMTRRKWTGLFIGFTGIVIVAQPDSLAARGLGVLCMLGAAICFSFCAVSIRTLVRNDAPELVAFVTLVWMSILSLPLALSVWVMPSMEQLPYLLCLAFTAAGTQFCVGKAFRQANVTTLQPLNFLTLVWSSIVAFIWFGEVIEVSTMMGAVLILFGITYSLRRNNRADSMVMNTPPSP